ncbi:uncharacterized protein LOC124708522 isoform X1 [Lolium rigidum]|uniref:uncharacterized protein LOC124708522 isoform X1 n=1 Tax=Lolium rigidum TaxID=89674 RepID=UPI001F5C82BF|nr:uncharacterized protein LOC124708522 isoform X1 [Lolium rigidum]
MEFPLEPASSAAMYEGGAGAAANGDVAVEDSACNHVGSVELDPSVAGILQVVAAAGNGDGDEQLDSAKCTVNQKFRVQNEASTDWTKRVRVGQAPLDRARVPLRSRYMGMQRCLDPCLGTPFDSLSGASGRSYANLAGSRSERGLGAGGSRSMLATSNRLLVLCPLLPRRSREGLL